MSELLFEIGTEEIPAGYIEPALRYLETASARKFQQLELTHGRIITAGTPRRLTLAVFDLQANQRDRRQEHIGPAAKAGFDAQGNPTKAAIGFAASKGLEVSALQVVQTPKGEYLMAVEEVKGRPTRELLPTVLEELIREIVFPKSMRWSNTTLSFARPLQWLTALFDGTVIEVTVEALRSSNTTRGHRFLAPESVVITNYENYVARLRDQQVLVDPLERRAAVVEQVQSVVRERLGMQEGSPLIDEELLDTVTNLVEKPFAVCGKFSEKFLAIPQEALITSMREHQKYFPVTDRQGHLLPLFVAVNNTRIEDRDLAVRGHERVLRARLEDGFFFFNEDQKKKLAERFEELSGIVFQNKLGTMKEKSQRVVELATNMARQLAPDMVDIVGRAARLAKTDLLTAMVGEFPSLQGVMGREYALLDGENQETAKAIYEHYLPLRAGDKLPESLAGALVGVADRMDTLVGCFAINEKPTGTTDPFGLRRQALGLIHILRGLKISLSLRDLASQALAGYEGVVSTDPQTIDQVLEFIRLRFENDCIAGGEKAEVVQGVTSVDFDDVCDCLARIDALNRIRGLEQFEVLAGSFKRIRNITKDNDSRQVDPALFAHETEERLHTVLTEVEQRASAFIEGKKYSEALEAMLEMKVPVDDFFDSVMVMVEDPAVRQNRLNLLTALGSLVLRVADISKMQGQ